MIGRQRRQSASTGFASRSASRVRGIRARRLLRTPGVVIVGVALAMIGCAGSTIANTPDFVTVEEEPSTVEQYRVWELTLRIPGAGERYADPFRDVELEAAFVGPDGERYDVGGFFYGAPTSPTVVPLPEPKGDSFAEYQPTGALELWKLRFAPPEPGTWRYTFTVTDTGGRSHAGAGALHVSSGPAERGTISINPQNPYRWVLPDGSAFHPLGLQDCASDYTATGSVLDTWTMDGPFRPRGDLPLPEGPEFVRAPESGPVTAAEYLQRFRDAGFNLFRFSQANCSFSIVTGWDEPWGIHESVMMDELLQLLEQQDYKVMYGLLGYTTAYTGATADSAALGSVRDFLRYSVNRWGAYADIWQLLNEQEASRYWIATMAETIRETDPYDLPVTTSWERPELDSVAINAPHWYESEEEQHTDTITASNARTWKRHGKPVIVGEQGNYVDPEALAAGRLAPGVGGTWDPTSGRRMRIRSWTAFFNEISLIFWHTGYARDGHFMNIWLGPEERSYGRSLQSFAANFGPNTQVFDPTIESSAPVRAYGLHSGTGPETVRGQPQTTGVYLVHHGDRSLRAEDVAVAVEAERSATAYWIDPATAEVVASQPVGDEPAEVYRLLAPPFAVDLALLLTDGEPPDVDRDGVPTAEDTDNDNDGVPDTEDAFPLLRWEWSDADGDRIGDNLDNDVDGDGIDDR